MKTIELYQVKEILIKLLSNEITKEEASNWAFLLRNDFDEGNLAFIPPKLEEIIWDSILFIEGIDLKDSPNSYLHNDADIENWLNDIKVFEGET